jgi:hypothetical protein
VQFINQASPQVGSNCGDSATELHVFAVGCGLAALQGGFDSIDFPFLIGSNFRIADHPLGIQAGT